MAATPAISLRSRARSDARAPRRQLLLQHQIAGREGIRQRQRASRCTAPSTRADAGQGGRAFDEILQRLSCLERQTTVRHRCRQRAQRCGARTRQADKFAPGVASRRRSGKGMRDPVRSASAAARCAALPQDSTKRRASVVAPATPICWPSTARTAVLKPSHPQGTRIPGC